MQLKPSADVELAINQVCFQSIGFAAVAGSSTTEEVVKCCEGVAGMYADVSAIPWPVLIGLVTQLIPIIFGEGGFTIEKLQAVLQLILSIFVPTP